MRDMTPRQVGLMVGAGGLLAAWLAAAAGAPGAGRAAQSPPPQPPAAVEDPVVAEIRQQTARLHAYLDRVPPRPDPARNPFRFASEPVPESRPVTAAPGAPQLSPPAVAPVSEAPGLRLIGIASSGSGARLVRTAIFAGPSDTYLAVTGDVVADRIRVGAIGADAVEVIRLDDGVSLTLALR